MKSRITKIGNSKGIIIPSILLKEFGVEGEVNLEVKDSQLIITKVDHPRQKWAEAIQKAESSDELIDDSTNDFDEEEWTW